MTNRSTHRKEGDADHGQMEFPSRQLKLEALKTEMEALRSEVRNRIETNSSVWKLVFTGLAAIVVLKADVRLEDYLPLVPLLVVGLSHLAITQIFYIFRISQSLARSEERINKLLEDQVLQHESGLWANRISWFRRSRYFFALLIAILPGSLLWIHIYMAGSKLGSRISLSLPIYISCVLLNVLFSLNVIRMWKLLRQNQ